MSDILIMGGTTFVSSSLAKHLISRGYKVDILTRGIKPISFTGFNEHIVCDRKKEAELKELLSGKQYKYVFDISAYTKEDVEILINSINKLSLKKYIFCSSGAVYKPNGNSISEDFERGENPYWGNYGLDKKEAEDFLFYMHKEYGFPVTIFRPPYIYGENNNLYREAYFFERIIARKVIPIPYGRGVKAQFIHIDDLVEIFESAMDNINTGKAYNVGYPEEISWEKLVKSCAEATGIEAIIKEIDVFKVDVDPRSYFPFRDVGNTLDTSSLIRDGFYVPTINLKEGLKKTYDWYKNEKPALSDAKMNRIEELSGQK